MRQSSDNVSPLNLSQVMKEMKIAPCLAGAILKEQIGDKYDISFQEARISDIPLRQVHQVRRKEKSLLVQLDDEEYFENTAGKTK